MTSPGPESDTATKKRGRGCRIIDFELSRKVKYTKEILNDDKGGYLERLIEELSN